MEKNIFYYIKIVANAKLFLITTMLASLVVSFCINTYYLQKKYEVTTTIIQPMDDKAVSNVYTQLLGSGGTDNMDQYITTFIKSTQLKTIIANKIAEKYPSEIFRKGKTFPNDIAKTHYVIKHLKLSPDLSFVRTKEGAFIISYQNSNPNIAFDVVTDTLETIKFLNEKLSVSTKKDFFIIMDAPEMPLDFTYPKKLRNMALTLIMTFAFSIFAVLARHAYLEYKKTTL